VPNGEKQFHLTDDIEALCDAIDRVGDVRLVTIDPVTAYLGNDQRVDSNKNASVRSALAPLQSRAARLDFAAVGISHLNKGGGTEALMRVLGSMAFIAAARAAFLVVAEKGTTRSLFIPMKNNIGLPQSGLAFRIVTKTILDGIETPAIEFDGDEITATADEALADSVGRDSGADQEKSSIGEAMTFVRDLLREGAVASREMFERGKEAGISKRSIERAKASLGVTARHRGEGGPSGRGEWIWELPVQVSLTKPAR
jgi:putative DNA primase/helicase